MEEIRNNAPETESKYLIEVKNLVKWFPIKSSFFKRTIGNVRAVDGISFHIKRGQTMGLVGESGCGKSTAGRTILRLIEKTSGEVLFDGQDIFKMSREELRRLRPRIQIIFQDPYSSLSPRIPVGEIIGEAVREHNIVPKEEFDDYISRIMRACGLQEYHKDRYPHEFSGGQRQRVGLARAMVMEPEFVVADEPISALDVSIRAQILNLMNKFQEEQGTTYLFIAHDLSIVRYISDRIGVIYKGKIVEIATSEELFNYPLHPYTRSLISAIPLPDPQLEKHKVLYTYDPDMHNYSESDVPELVNIGHEHYVYGNSEEIAEYKAIRDRGVPLKTISVVGVNAEASEESAEDSSAVSKEVILDRPVHDTGNAWYAILSFFLPIFGIIAAVLFLKRNYIRNYKACRKGVIAFAGFLGVCVALLLLFIVIAIL